MRDKFLQVLKKKTSYVILMVLLLATFILHVS